MFSGITFAELGWGRALLVAVCGLIVTFLMLAVLAAVIMIISKAVSALEQKKHTAVPSNGTGHSHAK